MRKILVVAIFLSGILYAYPPPVPGAGIIERELEEDYNGKPLLPDREIPAIQIDIPEERLSFPDGKKVFVKEIIVKGNCAISSKKIHCWIAEYENQELSISDIYEVCNVIDQNYAKKGYFLARAYPPPQTIQNGVVEIEILEGRLGTITVVGNCYYKDSYISGYFEKLQCKPIRYDDFLHALMLLNENSDLMAGALFEKGQEFGTADLIIRVEDRRPIHLYFNGNNYGMFLTTDTRVGSRFDWGNAFTQGDMLTMTGVVGFPVNALYFTDVSYTVPVNRTGSSLEVSYLFSKFKIEELRSLNPKGRSDIGSITYNQALRRGRNLCVDLFSYFDIKQIENFVLGQLVAFDKLRVLRIGTLIDHYSPCQGRDYVNVRFSAGIPNFLWGLHAVDPRASRKGGGGRFFIFNFDYDRIQKLPMDSYLYFHASGQLSPNLLTLPEQIYIGGVDTVRAFPLAIGLGDSGYYLNAEWRFPPPILGSRRVFNFNKTWNEILQFDVFLDHGGVFLNSGQEIFNPQKKLLLWGSGLGIRFMGPYNLNFSMDVGFPLNHRELTRGAFFYIKLTAQAF